jgi:hypothetical protein
MITEKQCASCGVVKSVMHFNQKLDTKDGYNNRCKDCRRAKAGHTKRRPRHERSQEVTYESLVQDICSMQRRYPTNINLRIVCEKLRNNVEHDEYVSDILYRAWEYRMRQVHDFAPLEENVPIISDYKQQENQRRELPLDWFE